MSELNVIKDATNKTLTIERVFPAPRARLWAAWSDPEKLAQWWGPRGWATTILTFEFKPGGVWHYCMKCEDKEQGEFYGQESWGKAIFQTINEPASLSYQDNFSDAAGTLNEAMPSMAITVEFVEQGDATKLVSRTVFESQEDYDRVVAMGVVEGLTQTWNRLEELVTQEGVLPR